MQLSTDSLVVVHDKAFKPLFDAEQIRDRTKEIADAITSDIGDKDPLVIAVLNGAFIFAADLTRYLGFDPEIHFIKLASYQRMQSSGEISQLIGLDQDKVSQRDVLIIEDIVDSGNTLAFLREQLSAMGASSISIVAMLRKPEAFQDRFPVDYVCFDIPNAFVVGYGLDYDGYGRSLDGIFQLAE